MTFEQLQQAVQFYVAQPKWVPAYLVALGGDTAPHSDPSHPPVPIQGIALHDAAADPYQHFGLEIDEFMNGVDAQIHIPPLTSTMNLAGHDVSRTSSANPNNVEIFKWQNNGTTFLIRAQIIAPLNEQDVEHMIASMLTPGSE